MTHIAHPYSLRLGGIYTWKSRWFQPKKTKEFLRSDFLIRDFFWKKFKYFSIDSIEIERGESLLNLIIKTGRPGLLIGRGGEGIEKIKKEIFRIHKKFNIPYPNNVKISVEEIKSLDSSAKIIAQNIAKNLEKRIAFRRTMKKTAEAAMAHKDNKGIKIILSGRLDGSEMSRTEPLIKGRMPLQTLRADIDYARERASLPYGDIGIKVWIYKGIK